MDVTGTVATRAFMNYSQEAKQFMRMYIRDFVLECWGKREFRLAVNFVRTEQEQELAQESIRTKPVPKSRYQSNRVEKDGTSERSRMPLLADLKATIEEQAESLIANLLWRLDNPKKNKSPALGIFQMHMSMFRFRSVCDNIPSNLLSSLSLLKGEWGYKRGILKTPVYEDSPVTLKKWKHKDNIKIYISFGTISFLQLIFANTTSGDLFDLLAGYFNLMDGNRKNFNNVSEQVNEPISKILFITRIPFDARIAQQSNIKTVIIVRQDFDPDAAIILKKIEHKRRKKEREQRDRSSSLGQSGLELGKLTSGTSSQENADEQKGESKKPKILSPVEDSELSTASKITAKDIQDFPVITRLDELVWE